MPQTRLDLSRGGEFRGLTHVSTLCRNSGFPAAIGSSIQVGCRAAAKNLKEQRRQLSDLLVPAGDAGLNARTGGASGTRRKEARRAAAAGADPTGSARQRPVARSN
jgi:hypothetical protein